jgi:hypothetical protein
MLFGHKDDFAIEAMTEPDLPRPSAVWGRMQIWCQGVSIGNYTEHYCALYGAYVGFNDLSHNIDQLWRKEFDGLEDRSLRNLLDGLLYGYNGDTEIEDSRSLEECVVDGQKYGQFNFLTNWGEQFDRDGKSFIFCQDGNVIKILNWHALRDRNLSFHVSVQSVREAIVAFTFWFDTESARLKQTTGFAVRGTD